MNTTFQRYLHALAIKYGGSSPNAVPAPQKKHSNLTLSKILQNEMISSEVMGGHLKLEDKIK